MQMMKKTLMLSLVMASVLGSTMALARDPDLALPRRLQEQEAKEWNKRAKQKTEPKPSKAATPVAPASSQVDMEKYADVYDSGRRQGFKAAEQIYYGEICNLPKISIQAQLLTHGVDTIIEDSMDTVDGATRAFIVGFDIGYDAGFGYSRFHAAKSADPCGDLMKR